ncbi:hypothetical protein LTR53_007368 [Teratosphaeriaceae sp. CCFEE 6253]|nr:hypothetical protein LTR53_007368 [Teratosphaeriaceae sp. CCFEE 6253]
MAQSSISQVGAAAIAQPSGGGEAMPAMAPELHHLKDETARGTEGTEDSSHASASQLGSEAVAQPSGGESLPAPAPELHHLESDEAEGTNDEFESAPRHSESQLGAAAIAPPSGGESLPAPAPELHHLKDDATQSTDETEATRHHSTSQLGAAAIAPPSGGEWRPAPAPALYHLDGDAKHDTDEPANTSHNGASQLGAAAVAQPSGVEALPAPAPELHHLNGDTKPDTDGTSKDSPKSDSAELTFPDLPPFPDSVPTAPLLRLSLQQLLDRDPAEEDRLWRACRELGFFYLDLRGGGGATSKRDSFHSSSAGELDGDALLRDADALFGLGKRVFDLPDEAKQEYDFKERGSYFGYKGIGAGVVDKEGTRDFNEFYNVSKNDVLGVDERLPAPEVLRKKDNRALLGSYCRRSHAVVSLLLGVLGEKLELPGGKLEGLHRLSAVSGDQVRWVRSPPQPAQDAHKLSLGEHTDFGSVTILFNRLGGLQILPPGTDKEWCFVKPLKGHCVVNLGDAMVKFTAGVLRSNIHRVVNPPGAQGESTRMSLVYFARPEDEVVLRVLEGSRVIDEARGEADEGGEEITAKEWILRRALGRRAGGDWQKSHGTEGDRVKQ